MLVVQRACGSLESLLQLWLVDVLVALRDQERGWEPTGDATPPRWTPTCASRYSHGGRADRARVRVHCHCPP